VLNVRGRFSLSVRAEILSPGSGFSSSFKR
jgi:hypothetical protein